MKIITLAGGCFWGIQKYYDQFEGITETTVGYANGFVHNPVYPDVKAQKTGHTEVCRIVYNEEIISLKDILNYFYQVIDPTSLNKQGEDEGTSYRTGIYYEDEQDKDVILSVTNEVQKQYDQKIVVEIEPLKCFYPAEEYHQKYLDKNPGGYCHIDKCFFSLGKKA